MSLGHIAQEQIREMVAKRAYEYYQKRGRQAGSELDDWLRAEREVLAAMDYNPNADAAASTSSPRQQRPKKAAERARQSSL